jgi:hypothetical protein
VETCHGTLLGATPHQPRPEAIHHARMGPRRVLWVAPGESDNDAGDAGVSQRGTPAWPHLPTTPTTALSLLLHTTSPSLTRCCWSCARARGLLHESTQCWRSSSPCRHEPASWSTGDWVPARAGDHLPGSRSIVGRHPFSGEDCPGDDGLASVVACAGAATRHATAGAVDRCRGCRGMPREVRCRHSRRRRSHPSLTDDHGYNG